MDEKRSYWGTVRTGRGGGAVEMSRPGGLEGFGQLTGLSVIPGTLNIKLAEPFDLNLLKYVSFANIGWEFDPATQGIRYGGEIGAYYRRVTVGGNYPACLFIFTWVTDVGTDVELVSPHHLRTVLDLNDGDMVEFTLDNR